MDKTLLALLIAPSLLFTWDCASANETKESVADSGDQSKQSRKSRKGDDDSKESRGEQNKGQDRKSERQQHQKRDSGDQIKRNVETEKKDQEFQERKSEKRDWDRSQKRDVEQKRDSSDQKWRWESDKRDAVKTLPNDFRDGDKDRTDYRRERISKERLREKETRWQSRSREWRKNFSNYRTRDHIFDNDFWDHFRRRHRRWNFDNNFQWYSVATWPRVAVWLPWQWSRPIYYYYEADGDVYYSTTEDYSYLTPVDSKEIFIAEAVRIANGRYPISDQQSDWMPLGMFTVASDDDSTDMPKIYISLAISKDGAVTGAYFDAASNSTFEIQGGIDPESQRIAWKFVGYDWPIMESGLYNLTKEESTLLIHTSSRTTETLLLIRLDS